MKFLEDCKFEWILFFILQLFLWPRALSLFLNNARTSCLSLLSDVDNLPFCFGEQRASTRPTPCIRSEKERGVSSPFPAFRIPRDVLIPWHMSRQRDRKLREGKQSGGSRPSRTSPEAGASPRAGAPHLARGSRAGTRCLLPVSHTCPGDPSWVRKGPPHSCLSSAPHRLLRNARLGETAGSWRGRTLPAPLVPTPGIPPGQTSSAVLSCDGFN